MQKFDWKKYVITFLITVIIFATAIIFANYFNNKKMDNLRTITDKISIDIMSSETQYSLLAESTCKDIGTNNALSQELNNLSQKLTYAENTMDTTGADLLYLKTYYSLLEIKDYLLMKKISAKCNTKPVFILYFYKPGCVDCDEQGYVLTYLREQYPSLRVYSFDYNLNVSALQTLISLYKISDNLPAIVINDKVYNGLNDKNKLTSLLPASLTASSTSTSTASTSKSKK